MIMDKNELLSEMSTMLDTKLKSDLQSELQPLKDKLKSDLQSELQPLKDEVRDVKQRVTSIALHIENITDKNIQLLAENYVPAAKRYEKAVSELETMQSDIDIMKIVITEHSEKLQKIS